MGLAESVRASDKKIITLFFAQNSNGRTGAPKAEDLLRLDYLDLCRPSLRLRPGAWEEEEAFFRLRLPELVVLPRARGFRENCLSCPFAFDQLHPCWKDPGTAERRGPQAVRSVTSFVFASSRNRFTGRKVGPALAAVPTSEPDSRTEGVAVCPSAHGRNELSRVLKLVYTFCGFMPSHLLSLAAGAEVYSVPPDLSSLLKKAQSIDQCKRLRNTYVAVLEWAKDLLWQSRSEGRLGKEEFCLRNEHLQLAIWKALPCTFTKTREGAFVVFTGVSGIGREVTFGRYMESHLRSGLLQRLAELPTDELDAHESILCADKTDLLSPASACALLALELYMQEGASISAVKATTLEEFLGRKEEGSQRIQGEARPGATYCWSAKSEVLCAPGTLVLALDGFVEALRPALLNGGSSGPAVVPLSAEDLAAPLLPSCGGDKLQNMHSSVLVLQKLGGAILGGEAPDQADRILKGLKDRLARGAQF
jgi:hypothetical protein